jgi:hypothetical protein
MSTISGNGVVQYTPKITMNGNATFGFNSSRSLLLVNPLSTCVPSSTHICVIHDGNVPGTILFYTNPAAASASSSISFTSSVTYTISVVGDIFTALPLSLTRNGALVTTANGLISGNNPIRSGSFTWKPVSSSWTYSLAISKTLVPTAAASIISPPTTTPTHENGEDVDITQNDNQGSKSSFGIIALSSIIGLLALCMITAVIRFYVRRLATNRVTKIVPKAIELTSSTPIPVDGAVTTPYDVQSSSMSPKWKSSLSVTTPYSHENIISPVPQPSSPPSCPISPAVRHSVPSSPLPSPSSSASSMKMVPLSPIGAAAATTATAGGVVSTALSFSTTDDDEHLNIDANGMVHSIDRLPVSPATRHEVSTPIRTLSPPSSSSSSPRPVSSPRSRTDVTAAESVPPSAHRRQAW